MTRTSTSLSARSHEPGEASGFGWPDILTALMARQDLAGDQTAWAMARILSGEATPSQVAGFVVALRAKGETVEEIEGIVEAIYAAATPLTVSGRTLDIVGTGGDRSFSVNISTMSALVSAGAGAKVVKHGNRSASSKSGTADVLERLGVRLDLSAGRVAALAESAGITFCFAAAFHPGFRHAAVTRRELGVATFFNIIGPLANPARPAAQAIGCADLRMAPIMAGVFAKRGADAWVFRGDDGLDELTTTTTSRIWEVRDGAVVEHSIDAADLGLARATAQDLRGGDPEYNAQVIRDLLSGKTGPVRDAVVLNAGAALAVYDAEPLGPGNDADRVEAGEPISERIRAGMARAQESLDSGAAARALERWVSLSAATA